MPIEFSCPGCSQSLRVPDEAAGKQAKCPKCSMVVYVPETSEPAPPIAQTPPGDNAFSEPPPSKPIASDNPYQSPLQPEQTFTQQPVVAGQISNRVVDAGDVLRHAWDAWLQNLGILVAVYVIVLAITQGFGYLMQFLMIFAQEANNEVAFFAIMAVNMIVGTCLNIFFQIGQTKVALAAARRKNVEIGDLFSGGPLFLIVLVTSIMFGFAVMMGFLLLIVPGVLLLLFFWPYYFLLIDRNAGIGDAFSQARVITQGNAGTVILLWLCSIGIVLVGLAACCLGVIVAAPLVSVMWATAYLMMSGQLAPQQPARPQATPGYKPV